jgi:hypothetical protein
VSDEVKPGRSPDGRRSAIARMSYESLGMTAKFHYWCPIVTRLPMS